MMRVVLQRLTTGDQGTFGVIRVGDRTWFTGELPWRDNASDVSCIPAGEYACRMTLSPRFKVKLYELFGVPGRFACRIHSANLMGDKTRGFRSQLNGCIALGQKLGTMDGQKAVLLSRPAVYDFQKATGGQPFILEVRHVV